MLTALIAMLGACIGLVPQPAEACGVFVPGPEGQPVEQTGETIVFVQDGGFIEAHVQITYDGDDAAGFSWVLPVPQVPEIEVGSQRFIDALRSATVPVYAIASDAEDACAPPRTTGASFIGTPDDPPPTDPQPDVLTQDTVGAFDFAVLQGGSSATIMTWLEDNGYSPTAMAPALFDAYLDEGSVFVAFRLNQQADVDNLHPIVTRYEGSQPCIPLRLTALAADDDMDVRAMFLGESRTLPINYKHVRINDAQINWLDGARNYADVVSAAIDEAGGRGFVTEYAGSSDVVSLEDINAGPIVPSAFTDINPLDVVDALIDQGLMSCTDRCDDRHPLVSRLLHEFIPAPPGTDPDVFYACLHCYERLIDLEAWDAEGFAQRFAQYVSDPIDHANDLLATSPYLTRLYTQISAHEMTADPMFEEVEDMPVVPHVRGGALTFSPCCEGTWELPSGARIVASTPYVPWDAPPAYALPQWSEAMPFAAVIQQAQPSGPPAIVIDNRDAIAAEIEASNALRGAECGGSGTDGDDAQTDSGSPESSSTDSSAIGTTGGSGGAASLDDGVRCAIDERDPRNPPGVFLGLMLLVACGRRRA